MQRKLNPESNQCQIFSYSSLKMFFQDEECKDTFTKDCYIEYINVPKSEQVEKCVTPWQRDCDTPGEQDCTTEYETSKVLDLQLQMSMHSIKV